MRAARDLYAFEEQIGSLRLTSKKKGLAPMYLIHSALVCYAFLPTVEKVLFS